LLLLLSLVLLFLISVGADGGGEIRDRFKSLLFD